MSDEEVSVHESSHAIQTLAAGDEIVSITIAADGSGLMRRRPEPWRGCPDPWHRRAVARAAIDVAGAVGVCRLHGRGIETLRTRADFVALRSGGDFDNFYSFAVVVCANDSRKVEALRQWALRTADETLARFWPAVLVLADCLVGMRRVVGSQITTILSSTPAGRELLGEEATHQATPHRVCARCRSRAASCAIAALALSSPSTAMVIGRRTRRCNRPSWH